MALKAMLKTLDGLNEAQKALYKQDGDKFLLDVEGVDGFELVGGGLKTALAKERDRAAELEKRMEALKDIDPDKARDALKRVDAMKNWTPEEKVQATIDAKLKELAAQKDAEYAPRLKDAEATRKAYESLVIDKALEDAAAKHKFLSPALALPHLRPSVGLLDNKPVVLDKDGKPRSRMDNNGVQHPVTIEEFVAEKAKDPFFAPLIAGNNATGSRGAAPQPGTTSKPEPQRLNPQEVNQRLEQAIAGRV